MRTAYTRGLHELGDGIHAYLQPDGGWGWSNAGLITAGGTSLLVDTLFDLRLTREMLEAMRSITADNPIDAAMNTHGNGDHCYGNQLLAPATKLYATRSAVAEMEAVPPSLMVMLLSLELDPALTAFVRERFGRFSFEDIELRTPSNTFEGTIELSVGDRPVSLIEVGPAHTPGDAIVHVPDAGVVFTGDILFIGGTPIVWAGPIANWLAACDRVLALDAGVLVPGHGPVTDAAGVEDVKRYLSHVRDEARLRFDAGMSVQDAADDIELGDFSGWTDPERIVVNVDAAYRELDPAREPTTTIEHLTRMARWAERH